jgi:hypothetical protein
MPVVAEACIVLMDHSKPEILEFLHQSTNTHKEPD